MFLLAASPLPLRWEHCPSLMPAIKQVEQAIKETGYTGFNGIHAPTNEKDNYSLDYSKLVLPIIKAMQEQQQMIDQLNKKTAEQDRIIAELKKRLDKLEN